MKSLISIHDNEGKKVVSARELYEYLGYDLKNWKRWYSKNIERNEFLEENVDYQTFVIMRNGNATKDFELTIKTAKKIALRAKTKVGDRISDYFIEAEKKFRELTIALTEQEKEGLKRENQVNGTQGCKKLSG